MKEKEAEARRQKLNKIFTANGRVLSDLNSDTQKPESVWSKLQGKQVRWQFEYDYQKFTVSKTCGLEYKEMMPYAVDQEFE